MLIRLGEFTVRRRKAILVGTLLFVVASFAVAGGVAERLTSGGFADPSSGSERAAALLQREFGAKEPNVELVVSAKHGSVDDAAVRAAGLRITRELSRQRSLRQVVSYWSLDQAAPLKSKDGRQAIVPGVIAGSDDHVNDFTPTGTLAATMPILMFCVAFGLSMDYEVFLLSRIKEEHDVSHDNVRSVALGLERTGRIVTAAAVLISVVFIAFATSGVAFVKLFGIGLALAVLMDAFVIRTTLVPAFMRLAGEVNWWAPAPMRRFYERFGISETEPPSVPSPDRDSDRDPDRDDHERVEPVGAS